MTGLMERVGYDWADGENVRYDWVDGGECRKKM